MGIAPSGIVRSLRAANNYFAVARRACRYSESACATRPLRSLRAVRPSTDDCLLTGHAPRWRWQASKCAAEVVAMRAGAPGGESCRARFATPVCNSTCHVRRSRCSRVGRRAWPCFHDVMNRCSMASNQRCNARYHRHRLRERPAVWPAPGVANATRGRLGIGNTRHRRHWATVWRPRRVVCGPANALPVQARHRWTPPSPSCVHPG